MNNIPMNFQFTQSFQPHYGPGVDSASNRNEYQEYFWVVKGGLLARKAHDLTAICEPIIQKMWEPRCLIPLWASTACCRDNCTSTDIMKLCPSIWLEQLIKPRKTSSKDSRCLLRYLNRAPPNTRSDYYRHASLLYRLISMNGWIRRWSS
jgi:hypothetical protein